MNPTWQVRALQDKARAPIFAWWLVPEVTSFSTVTTSQPLTRNSASDESGVIPLNRTELYECEYYAVGRQKRRRAVLFCPDPIPRPVQETRRGHSRSANCVHRVIGDWVVPFWRIPAMRRARDPFWRRELYFVIFHIAMRQASISCAPFHPAISSPCGKIRLKTILIDVIRFMRWTRADKKSIPWWSTLNCFRVLRRCLPWFVRCCQSGRLPRFSQRRVVSGG